MTVSETQKTFLLLLPPAVVTQPELAAELMGQYSHGQDVFHHQVLDRVTEGAIQLRPNYYTQVHLMDTNGTIELDGNTFDTVYKSIARDGRLTGVEIIDSKTNNMNALMAGFVANPQGGLTKPAAISVPVSLKKRNNDGTKRNVLLPKFKKMSLEDDDDELIDENELIDEEDSLTPVIQVPAKCDPGPGKKRRKACKDCTCGLKDVEEQGVQDQRSAQDSVVTLAADDTAEVDFTVQGKTGSCGSCALGDAFRCDGCPYVGLPPFKPGEVVSISSLGGDDL